MATMNKNTVYLLSELKHSLYDYEEVDHQSKIFKELKQFFLSSAFTDVTIRVENEVFDCHRLILAANSPYFRTVFKYNIEKEICLPPFVSAKAFSLLLDFMYSSHLPVSHDNATEVLEAADFLQLRNIVEKCSYVLLQSIDVNNCLYLLNVGESHSCPVLAEYAQVFILDHFDDILKTSDFLQMSFRQLLELLNSEKLRLGDGYEFLSMIEHWAMSYLERYKQDGNDAAKLFDDVIITSDINRQLVNCMKLILNSEKVPDCEWVKLLTAISVGNRLEVIVAIPSCIKRSQQPAGTNNAVATMFFMHPHTKEWHTFANFPYSEREAFSACVVQNKLCLTGGMTRDIAHCDAWLLDSDMRTWYRVADMLKARANHSSTEHRGQLLVFGGMSLESAEPMSINDGEVYDSSSNQWTVFAPLLYVLGIGRATLVSFGRELYVIGGLVTAVDARINDTESRRIASLVSRSVTGDQILWGGHLHDNKKAWRYVCDSNSGSSSSTGSWSTCVTLTEALGSGDISCLSPCMMFDGYLLFTNDKSKPLHVYDLLRETCALLHRSSSMHCLGTHVRRGDDLYSIGGIDIQAKTPHDLVHSLRLRSDDTKWTMLPSLPCAVSQPTCVTLFIRHQQLTLTQ